MCDIIVHKWQLNVEKNNTIKNFPLKINCFIII